MERNEIHMIYGTDPGTMVRQLLESTGVEKEIAKDARIALKPNLVVAKPCASGATTSPELTAGVVAYLREKGFSKIFIMEGSWVGERTDSAFSACGYRELSRRLGVPLVDLQKDKARLMEAGGMKIAVCESALSADFIINLPVLKGHCQTGMTCALKNMKGCIPDSEKRRFHTLGLHRPIACLNKILRQGLVIVDGMCGDLNFEEGGNPVPMNRLMAGRDPVLVDACAARLLGFAPEEIEYIGLAEALGVGSGRIEDAVVRELNRQEGARPALSSRRARQLAAWVEEDCACSACYGSLIHALERLDGRGELRRLKEKIRIGQGYRGKTAPGMGVGACTAGMERHVAGCPPTARDIVEFLEREGSR